MTRRSVLSEFAGNRRRDSGNTCSGNSAALKAGCGLLDNTPPVKTLRQKRRWSEISDHRQQRPEKITRVRASVRQLSERVRDRGLSRMPEARDRAAFIVQIP